MKEKYAIMGERCALPHSYFTPLEIFESYPKADKAAIDAKLVEHPSSGRSTLTLNGKQYELEQPFIYIQKIYTV